MDYWLWLVQIASVLFLVYFYVNRRFSYWTDRGLKGPTPLPFFGNFWESMLKGQIVTEMEWSKKFGKVFGQYMGFEPVLKIADNELIKQVMVRDFNLFVNRRAAQTKHEIWSRNLFGLENDDWKRIRSITSPSFTSGKLKGMNPLMHRCIDKLIGYFDKLSSAEDKSFNTKDVIAGFTIDVIASTSFATDTNSNDDRSKQNSFVDHGMKLFLFSKFRIFVFIFLPMWLRNKIGLTLGFEPEHFNFFRDLAKQVIKQRKETNVKRNDFVQLLMDSNVSEADLKKLTYEELTASADKEATENPEEISQKVNHTKIVKALDDNEIIAQCILFFIAGFETTASTITHCLFELAKNPETQDLLNDELQQKLEGLDENSEQYYETVLTKIPYLDSVIKETLRKYPPLPVLERRVSVPGYKLGGIELKKDQVVHIAAYAVHHNAEYYPEPERFNPDRFMPENKHLLKPYTYLPFGQGPRNCIGMRFAYQEIKLCLAKIIPRFQFSPTPETPSELQFVKIGLLSVKPFPLKVNKREKL